MTITEVPPRAARSDPDPTPLTAVSETPESASAVPDFVSGAASTAPSKPAKDSGLMVALLIAAAIGGIAVGLIGFATSYNTLAHVAGDWGFTEALAGWFPIGVDASIIAFLALDLYLIHKDTPWPLLRLAAHGMTGATIWFNASAQGSIQADPVQAAAHGVMPVLFVIGVEAARRLFIKKAKLASGTAADAIPFHRWILRPFNTPRFYRRMRLWGITSYPEMIRRDQDLIAYELWLRRKHKGDLSKATEDERLPMTMAPYGYTVAEALAMPDEQDQAAEARAEAAERRRLEAKTRRKQAEAQAEADELRADGELEAVRIQVESSTRAAKAEGERRAAAADIESEAAETANTAEARERAAEANRRAAEAEKDAAEKKAHAAEARAREEAAREAAERSKRSAAEAKKAAAEAEEAAAEKRLRAAEVGQRAVEAEDAERLTPRERSARKVARMILQAGGDANAVTLADIQHALGVTTSTASEYRQEAAQLLAGGYRP